MSFQSELKPEPGRARRLVIVALMALSVSCVKATPAPEYGGAPGDLMVTQSRVFSVLGGGFTPGSEVTVAVVASATGQELPLGTLTVDGVGTATGSVTLPDRLAPGRYTFSMVGVTQDGTTQVLSAEIDLST